PAGRGAAGAIGADAHGTAVPAHFGRPPAAPDRRRLDAGPGRPAHAGRLGRAGGDERTLAGPHGAARDRHDLRPLAPATAVDRRLAAPVVRRFGAAHLRRPG